MKPFEVFIRSLLEKEIIPGISLLIGKKGNIVFKGHYGWKSLVPDKEELTEDTLYDLASLTKPLVTAFLILHLVEQEKISLETPIRKFFPGMPAEFTFTLLQLATHTSGLPAWYPFYLFDRDYLGLYPSLHLESRPGKKVNYSCVGYILLYYLIEKIAGLSFKEVARQVIFKPLGLERTFLEVPEALKTAAAPTEYGNRYEKALAEQWAEQEGAGECRETRRQRVLQFKWRDSIIQGEAHDINSHYLGGTAGNAGLFSTTGDVFRICREFFPATASLLKAETLQWVWKNFTPFKKSHRTVGFKRNSSLLTSGGRALSGKAIGHNGFTGTSLWLEPRQETVIILLTNRIHPGFKAVNFDKIRRKLHKLLIF